MVPSSKYLEKICEKLMIKDSAITEVNVNAVRKAMAADAYHYYHFYTNPDEYKYKSNDLEEELSLVQRFYLLKRRNISEHIQFTCGGCYHGGRKGVCKHVIALGIFLKVIEVPAEKDVRCIKKMKGPGRPKKPKGAWEMNSDSELEDEDEACVVCGGKDSLKGNPILFCDTSHCNLPYHRKCANLKKLPAKAAPWYCPHCEGTEHPKGKAVPKRRGTTAELPEAECDLPVPDTLGA